MAAAALPDAVKAADTPIEAWHQDGQGPKAIDRVGQQGTLADAWAKTGSRPEALKDLRYQWADLFGVVCAERGASAGLALPYANAQAMSLHLAETSRNVGPGAHAIVALDGAGWHRTGGRLCVPGNVSLLHLPPYSPELNPVEAIWEHLRGNTLGNRAFANDDAVVAACRDAWNWLVEAPDRIRSIATRSWVKTVTA